MSSGMIGLLQSGSLGGLATWHREGDGPARQGGCAAHRKPAIASPGILR